MNWKYILKNQITDSKQGVLTSDAPLPKKKKKINDCKKQLEKWLGNAVLIKERYGLSDSDPKVHERWYDLPESTACKALKWFRKELDYEPMSKIPTESEGSRSNLTAGRTRSNSIDDYIFFTTAPAIYTHTFNEKVTKFFKVRAEIKTMNWETVIAIEIIAVIEDFNNHGQGYMSFEKWGRDNLDFRK